MPWITEGGEFTIVTSSSETVYLKMTSLWAYKTCAYWTNLEEILEVIADTLEG
jgi:hypothetical protein